MLYNKKLKRSKKKSWRSFCKSIFDFPVAARLQRVMAKDHSNQIGHLLKANCEYTNDAKERLKLLLSTHSPGAHIVTTDDKTKKKRRDLAASLPHHRKVKGLDKLCVKQGEVSHFIPQTLQISEG